MNGATTETAETLGGFITEQHFTQAEVEFPGITGFFASLVVKPKTFLDLVVAFMAQEAN